MKYVWIENNRIRDIAPGNPTEFYHPDVAAFYDTQVPDDAANGDGWVDGALVKPIVAEAVAPTRQWAIGDFRAGMTLSEKTKWDNDTAPEIVTVKQELPKEETETIELLDFLLSEGIISSATKDRILL